MEKLNFYTRAKGAEARMAQSSDRVKTRSAAYAGLGANPMRQAKIATLDHLLKSGVFGVDARGQPSASFARAQQRDAGGDGRAAQRGRQPQGQRASRGSTTLVWSTAPRKRKRRSVITSRSKGVRRPVAHPAGPQGQKPWEFGGGEWAPTRHRSRHALATRLPTTTTTIPICPESSKLPKALRRSIMQEEGRQMVQQPTPQSRSNNTKEWVDFADEAPANDPGPSSSSDPGGATRPPRAWPLRPGSRQGLPRFSITDLPDDDDDDDDDDVVVQDMSFGLGDESSSRPGSRRARPEERGRPDVRRRPAGGRGGHGRGRCRDCPSRNGGRR